MRLLLPFILRFLIFTCAAAAQVPKDLRPDNLGNIYLNRPTDDQWERTVLRFIDLAKPENAVFNEMTDAKANITSLTATLYSLAVNKVVTAYELYGDTLIPARAMPDLVRDSVKGFQLIESWKFDRNRGVMFLHLIAISPCTINHTITDSVVYQPAFWILYPLMRSYLKDKQVRYKEKLYTCDDYFENRLFSSAIEVNRFANRNKAKE